MALWINYLKPVCIFGPEPVKAVSSGSGKNIYTGPRGFIKDGFQNIKWQYKKEMKHGLIVCFTPTSTITCGQSPNVLETFYKHVIKMEVLPLYFKCTFDQTHDII